MVVEPTDFNVFGIRVKEENLIKIRSAMNETYGYLTKNYERWEDTEFCKREIASLWEAIVEMLWRLSGESLHEVRPEELKTLLITDRDNQEFLSLLGEALRRHGALEDILRQLNEVKIELGSLRISFRDSIAQKISEAKIEVNRMLKQIQRESSKIESGLRHFVDWARHNIRPIITCSLVAGVIVTSLAAICFIGIPILSAGFLIMTALAVICLIYEAYGAYGTINEARKTLSRRLGLST